MALKEIPLSIDRFFQSKRASTTTIGSDDLLPIVAWCMIKANIPCLTSELAFLEDFLHSFASQGEAGFTLVTIQAAIFYISGLDTSSLASNLAEIGPIAGAIKQANTNQNVEDELFPPAPSTAVASIASQTIQPRFEDFDDLDDALLDHLMDQSNFNEKPSYL